MIIEKCLPVSPEEYFSGHEYSDILRAWCRQLTVYTDRLIYNLISSVCSVTFKDTEFADRLYKDTRATIFGGVNKENTIKSLIEQYKKMFEHGDGK